MKPSSVWIGPPRCARKPWPQCRRERRSSTSAARSATVCHGPRDPAQFTPRQWQGITQSMFPRAGLNEEEKKLVREFLMQNAKPE